MMAPDDHLALRIHRAFQILHDGRALRLPAILAPAHPLHAYRTPYRLRHDRGIRDRVVEAVAAISARRAVPDELDAVRRNAEQRRGDVPRLVRHLRAGIDDTAVILHIDDGAGRTDRAVHLERRLEGRLERLRRRL